MVCADRLLSYYRASIDGTYSKKPKGPLFFHPDIGRACRDRPGGPPGLHNFAAYTGGRVPPELYVPPELDPLQSHLFSDPLSQCLTSSVLVQTCFREGIPVTTSYCVDLPRCTEEQKEQFYAVMGRNPGHPMNIPSQYE